MEVSVIIPTYNRADKTCAAIASVIAQTHAPTEVIVVDDGSTDETLNTISSQFPTVTLLTQTNEGVSSARNTGIIQAAGKWLAFLDSDDTWLPEKLEKQAAASKGNPQIKVIHSDEIWIRDGVRVNPMKKHQKPTGWIYPQCLPLCCVSPSSVLIEAALFDEVGLFDEGLAACEDYDMWLRMFSRYPVHLVNEALLVKTGGHEDQLSRKHWGMDRFRVTALHNILQAGLLDNAQIKITTDVLKAKCDVLIAGGLKRGNTDLVEQCQFISASH